MSSARHPSTVPEAAATDYASGRTSFALGLAPSDAVALGVKETLSFLRQRYGPTVDLALEAATRPWSALDSRTRRALASPIATEPNGRWVARANIVGINVRSLPDLWSVVPYTLTIPAIQSAIHLLPMLEPGVLSSVYAPTSWAVDPALRSERFAAEFPDLESAEAQLRAIVHLLHVTGRAVGMDVIPHTDRFAEIVLAQPDHFEWLERSGTRILRHGAGVVADVERRILRWLANHGPAVAGTLPSNPDGFFRQLPETERGLRLFGRPDDHEARRTRRVGLISDLHSVGFETVPATMGPPYRGLEVDVRPEAVVVDDSGLDWREYRITEPEPQSRVFGPLTRYDLYEPGPTYEETGSSAAAWALDTTRPKHRVWYYVAEGWASLVDRFGFDFMRGDMAHVQVRVHGVPAHLNPQYDILGFTRRHIARTRERPSFGYFAETFLVPPGTMAFGDELDHLEAAGADATLGDLQSVATTDPDFVRRLRRYRDVLGTRSVAPSLTMFTADKDDPRFDALFLEGNELRMLIGLLLPDMPSYMSLGFEQRDRHPVRAPNEHYTKMYVFRHPSRPSVTRGPYTWGTNQKLLLRLTAIRAFADGIRDELERAQVIWLRPPDATGEERVLAWALEGKAWRRLVVANLDPGGSPGSFGVPGAALAVRADMPPVVWRPEFSTMDRPAGGDALPWNGHQWVINDLAAGEGRVFRGSRR